MKLPNAVQIVFACAALQLATAAAAQEGRDGRAQERQQSGQQSQPAAQPGPVPRTTLTQDASFYDQLRSFGGGPFPAVPLERLLALVTASSGKRFLVDPRVPQNVLGLGDDVPTSLSYGALLSILRNNGFATVEIDGVVNILPESDMRHQPLPVVQQDERDRAADEWITRIIETQVIEAAQLVPILRPLIPVGGHLAALPPNRLIIVDRYANVRRIAAIVAELDEQQPAQR
jgi:hypothetical protein